MMQYVVSEIAPDMIFWTGDNTVHDVWKTTLEEVSEYTKVATDYMKEAIGDAEISVFPIQGNHDTWPTDE